MAVAKRQRREKPMKLEQRTDQSESLMQNKQPSLHRAALQFTEGRLRGRRKKHIKRGAKFEPLASLPIFRVGLPSRLKDVFSFACQIKLSCSPKL